MAVNNQKQPSTKHIFLSYSRDDNSIMHRVRSELEKNGLSVWTDEGLKPGTESWKDAIEESIIQAKGVVVILTPKAKESSWVERELDFASEHKVPIYPLLAKGNPSNAIPLELISAQRIDIRYKGELTHQIELLSSALLENRDFGEIRYQTSKRRKHLVAKIMRGNFTFIFTLSKIVIVLGILVAVSYLIVQNFDSNQSDKMMGEFNIAVAEFDVIDSSKDTDAGLQFSQIVVKELEKNLNEVDPNIDITYWGPSRVGKVAGLTKENRAMEAQDIAEKINADIVLYGIVDNLSAEWSVTPEFYFSLENSYDAEEIVGQHNLGSPILLPDKLSITSKVTLGDEMLVRNRILASISIGLAFYSVDQFDDALHYYQIAEETVISNEVEGIDVVYLLAGNAALRNRDISLARSYYQKAIDNSPEYSRALIGMGWVNYYEALDPFEQTNDPAKTDQEKLLEAIRFYEAGLVAEEKPILADIETKVHFGLGHSYFLQAYASGIHDFEEAITEFEAVIGDYSDGENPRVKVLAEEAHGRLGLIYKLQQETKKAIDQYNTAASLCDNHDKKSFYEDKAQELIEP
mgnify:CR=1 FL=1